MSFWRKFALSVRPSTSLKRKSRDGGGEKGCGKMGASGNITRTAVYANSRTDAREGYGQTIETGSNVDDTYTQSRANLRI